MLLMQRFRQLYHMSRGRWGGRKNSFTYNTDYEQDANECGTFNSHSVACLVIAALHVQLRFLAYLFGSVSGDN